MQDDDAAWGQNPFDVSTDGVTDGTSAESQALADIDARIQEYRGEHIWDEEGYMRSLRYTNQCTVSEHCCEVCETLRDCCYNRTLYWCTVAVQLCSCARGKICCNYLTLAQGMVDCLRCQVAVNNSHPYGACQVFLQACRAQQVPISKQQYSPTAHHHKLFLRISHRISIPH